MKVILLENIANLGQKTEIKDVADGYALNFLIPQGKARFASPEAIHEVESQKQKEQERNTQWEKEILENLNKLGSIDIERKTNEEGHLFAGVNKKDIVSRLGEEGIEVEEDAIVLEEPIKELGKHEALIKVAQESIPIQIEVVSKD